MHRALKVVFVAVSINAVLLVQCFTTSYADKPANDEQSCLLDSNLQTCDRCSDMVNSVSREYCCNYHTVYTSCVKLLQKVDNVESMLQNQVASEKRRYRYKGKSANRKHTGLDEAHTDDLHALFDSSEHINDPYWYEDNGKEFSKRALQKESIEKSIPESSGVISKRRGLSGMYNRVWWRAPNKRPRKNKVFKNYNRIWYKG